jgi:hypothetical protein
MTNPLGDPADPAKPINLNFAVLPASTAHCMQVGNNTLTADLTSASGPDNQPYFGGRRLTNAQNAVVHSFNGVPGGPSKTACPTACGRPTAQRQSPMPSPTSARTGCGHAHPVIAYPSTISRDSSSAAVTIG